MNATKKHLLAKQGGKKEKINSNHERKEGKGVRLPHAAAFDWG